MAEFRNTEEELRAEIEELRRQLQEANAANVAKETFLSNMSHDIRTPMNAIVGMTALAKKHIDEKARVLDALNKIDTAGAHLLNLINDVLDMSRINSGRMTLAAEPFSLPELIHETVGLIKPQSEKRHQTSVLYVDDVVNESFYGDVLRIRQVLVNILSNAVKYTPEGGHIEFTVGEEPGGDFSRLLFTCRDNGIGMAPEFLARIFEPFERAGNTTLSGAEGTGLGMSIVKKIVDAMDGTIDIESRPGEGTAVRISLPLRPVEERADTKGLEGRRVLVIESNERLRRKYRTIFESCGIDCTITSSAGEAIAAVTETGFDSREYTVTVIGEDRGDSGSVLEIASYFSKSYPGMTIVLVSSDRWEDMEYQAGRCGIAGFIPVPFFRKSLINGLSRAVNGQAETAASEWPDLAGRHVLLVEDNLINREIAKEILSVTGASIETAENGKEALERFCASGEGYFSLILMDVQMPVMDGYTATRAIRSCGRGDAGLPIFAMTANTFAEDVAKAREAGMDGHIAKPIDISALMQTIGRVLS